MTYKPPHIEKKYYAVGEVAALLNVSTSLLRSWEKKFPSIKPLRTSQGLRRYTKEHIAHLQSIQQLIKEEGYTLQGAKQAVAPKKKRQRNISEVVKKLESLKQFLIQLRERTHQS